MSTNKKEQNGLRGAAIGAVFGIFLFPIIVVLIENKMLADFAIMMAMAPFAFCCFLGFSGIIFSAVGFIFGLVVPVKN